MLQGSRAARHDRSRKRSCTAAAPIVEVLREAEQADTVEERFREELQARGLDGEWRHRQVGRKQAW